MVLEYNCSPKQTIIETRSVITEQPNTMMIDDDNLT